jgi:hypothetical protein
VRQAFTFQTLALLRAWTGGQDVAFPKDPSTPPWSYGLVNLAIYAAGLGLIALGHRLAGRRGRTAPATADLASPADLVG